RSHRRGSYRQSSARKALLSARSQRQSGSPQGTHLIHRQGNPWPAAPQETSKSRAGSARATSNRNCEREEPESAEPAFRAVEPEEPESAEPVAAAAAVGPVAI